MKCSKDAGRIALIRGAAPDVRYVGKCDDCGLATEPTDLTSASRALKAHRTPERLGAGMWAVIATINGFMLTCGALYAMSDGPVSLL